MKKLNTLLEMLNVERRMLNTEPRASNVEHQTAARCCRRMACLLAIAFGCASTHAILPEPDNIVYGTILIGETPVTALDFDVLVEARRGTLEGPVIGSYAMGSNPRMGDQYSIDLKLEWGNPVMDDSAVQPGDTVYLIVSNALGVQHIKSYTAGERGQVVQIDFGDIDLDENGLLDEWEHLHFGGTGQDPNLDTDNDGRSNGQEHADGTNPNEPDTPHPADSNPKNFQLSVTEITAYGLAWKINDPDIEPEQGVGESNEDYAARLLNYVTRSWFLWQRGEYYKQDLVASTTAPLWWINTDPPVALQRVIGEGGTRGLANVASVELGRSLAIRSMASAFVPGETFEVELEIIPAKGTTVFAVSEIIPDNWTADQISHDGQLNSNQHTIHWGPFLGDEAITLTYQGIPNESASNQGNFLGAFSLDGVSQPIAGDPSAYRKGSRIQLSALGHNATDGVKWRLQGLPLTDYIIESTEDFLTWSERFRLRSDSEGLIEWNDPAHVGASVFYRAQIVVDGQSLEAPR